MLPVRFWSTTAPLVVQSTDQRSPAAYTAAKHGEHSERYEDWKRFHLSDQKASSVLCFCRRINCLFGGDGSESQETEQLAINFGRVKPTLIRGRRSSYVFTSVLQLILF